MQHRSSGYLGFGRVDECFANTVSARAVLKCTQVGLKSLRVGGATKDLKVELVEILAIGGAAHQSELEVIKPFIDKARGN